MEHRRSMEKIMREMQFLHEENRKAKNAAYQARRISINALLISTAATVLAGIAIIIATAI